MTFDTSQGAPLSDSAATYMQKLEVELANMRADRDAWRTLAADFRRRLDEKTLALVRVSDLLAQWDTEDRHAR